MLGSPKYNEKTKEHVRVKKVIHSKEGTIFDFMIHPPNDKLEITESPLLIVLKQEIRRCPSINNVITNAEFELVEKLLQEVSIKGQPGLRKPSKKLIINKTVLDQEQKLSSSIKLEQLEFQIPIITLYGATVGCIQMTSRLWVLKTENMNGRLYFDMAPKLDLANKKVLYQKYLKWCKNNSEKSLSNNIFGKKLSEKNIIECKQEQIGNIKEFSDIPQSDIPENKTTDIPIFNKVDKLDNITQALFDYMEKEAEVLVALTSETSETSKMFNLPEPKIIEVNIAHELIDTYAKDSNVTTASNKIQKEQTKQDVTNNQLKILSYFFLEKGLKKIQNINTINNLSLQELADIIIMLCIRPTEVSNL
ncbi:6825_t:CDS:2 [Cetraspora pellucida]|uniref:6825_t:CDS:1 n=1 Tax=Cetraspora pellucida TaxID=1433469 RepID=A0A9N9A6K2_9GLOM|nr:6825_t:CDS:2 [Cetraspora pellucida]